MKLARPTAQTWIQGDHGDSGAVRTAADGHDDQDGSGADPPDGAGADDEHDRRQHESR